MSDKCVRFDDIEKALLSPTWGEEDGFFEVRRYFKAFLRDVPTFDLIRCRDCEYYLSTHINGERYSACTYHILTRQHREPEDYCSRAKKREEEK